MGEDIKRSQCQRVLEFIDKHGSINPMQALVHLAVMRLAARIKDLREDGVLIDDKWVEDYNRFGEKVRYKEYRRNEG